MELKKGSVAYIVSNFPCYSETFVLSELVQLRQEGIDIVIFSLRAAREKQIQDEARPLLANTFYSPFFLSARLIFANLYYLCARPGTYLSLLREIVSAFRRRPLLLLKNLAIWPKSVHFAYFARGRGVRHIHAHFANYPALSAMIVSRFLGIPFSFMSHAHDLYVDHTMVDRKTKLAAHTITISRFNNRNIHEKFPSLDPRKIEVLGASIDTSVFAPVSAGESREGLELVAVGRLFPKKGFRYLVEACRDLKLAGVLFTCHIVGEGPEEEALRGLIGDLGLEDSVVLEGPLMREGVLEILKGSDLLVCPSVVAEDVEILDGIPVVLMEAMAMGLPVVATRVSGIPELVLDGETGLLVEQRDPHALAAAITRVYRDASLRGKLSLRGRERVLQKHDVVKNAHRLMEVFFE